MPVVDNKHTTVDSHNSAQNGGSGQQKHGSSRRVGSNKRSGSKSMVSKFIILIKFIITNCHYTATTSKIYTSSQNNEILQILDKSIVTRCEAFVI